MSMLNTESSAAPSPEPLPSRNTLRKLVMDVAPEDSDLQALIGDFFPDVQKRLTNGMDRVAKVNLLLSYVEPAPLLAALREHNPRRFECYRHPVATAASGSDAQYRRWTRWIVAACALLGLCASLGLLAFWLEQRHARERAFEQARQFLLQGNAVEAASLLRRAAGGGKLSPEWRVLMFEAERSTRAGRSLFAMNRGRMTGAAFSPDASRVAVGCDDGSIVIFDVRSGQRLATLLGHSARVLAVAMSRDGEQVASGHEDHTARLWDVRSEKLVRVLGTHQDGVDEVRFSLDGKHLETRSWDGAQHQIELATGADFVKRRTSPVSGAPSGETPKELTSLDGARMLEVESTGQVSLRLSDNRRLLGTLRHASGAISSAIWSPDGTRVLTLGSEAVLWNLDAYLPWKFLPAHNSAVVHLAWSPAADLLVSVATDGTAALWDVETLRLRRQLGNPELLIATATFNRTGTRILTSSKTRAVRAFDSATGILVQAEVSSMDESMPTSEQTSQLSALRPGGALRAEVVRLSGTQVHHTLLIKDATTLAVIMQEEVPLRSVSSLVWSPDGNRLSLGGDDGSVLLRDVGEASRATGSFPQARRHYDSGILAMQRSDSYAARCRFREARDGFHAIGDVEWELQALWAQAAALEELTDRATADATYRAAEGVLEQLAPSPRERAQLLSRIGATAHETLHVPATALRAFDAALRLIPDDPMTRMNRLESLLSLGRWADVLSGGDQLLQQKLTPPLRVVVAVIGFTAAVRSQSPTEHLWGQRLYGAYAALRPYEETGWDFGGLLRAINQQLTRIANIIEAVRQPRSHESLETLRNLLRVTGR